MIRLPFAASTPLLVAFVLACACPTAAATAQDDALPPAHLSYVDGRVLLDREGGTEEAEEATPLVAGDRVRTEDGRAELLFGDGSLVQVDAGTTLDLLSDARLRVLGGRIAIVATSAQAGQLQIDTPEGSIDIRAAGEYRVALLDDEGRGLVELSVVRGVAGIASDRDQVVVQAGERSWARNGEAPALPVRFNAASFDAFDRWALDRAALRRGTASAQYVPATLRSYSGVLDTYGAWSYEPTYGYVWYPRVGAGWRPYYAGRWRFYGGFGWTWTGGGAWGWPTHHYGRWGLSNAGAWFWIPGAQWGPAWVSWAVASNYVSWCPIGYDNRPVIGFHGHGGAGAHGAHAANGHDPWHAWTVVPRGHFGGSRAVNGVAVDGRRVAAVGRAPAFILQDRAPVPPRVGVRAPRGANALGVAVPRGSLGAPAGPGVPPGRRESAGAVSGPSSGGTSAGASAAVAPRGTRGFPHASSAVPPPAAARAGVRSSPLTERAPEGASRVGPTAPAASRSSARLPGDVGARTPGGLPQPPGRNLPDSTTTMPGSRGGYSAPRTSPGADWRPGQIPVHRGMPMEPEMRGVTPPATRPGETAPGAGRGSSMRDPSLGAGTRPAGPSVAPPGAVPRGGRMTVPEAPRATAPAPSSIRSVAPPSSPPPPPPPAAAPRQAPAGERGGSAVPRGGPPPSRHR